MGQGRGDDDARMQGVTPDPVAGPAPVQFHGEEHVGGLGLAVGQVTLETGGEVRVVPADVADPMGAGGHVHDPGAVRGTQRGPHAEGQLEVPEMVGRERRLVTARVQDPPGRAAAGVVDQDVQRAAGIDEPGGEGVDRGRVEQVQPVDLDAFEPGQRGGGAAGVARPRDDGRARPAERAGGLQAEPGVTAGDDHVRTGQVDALEHLAGRRRGGEARTDGMLPMSHEVLLESG